MINSGAIENFIVKEYVESKKYPIRNKKKLYGLVNLNSILLSNN